MCLVQQKSPPVSYFKSIYCLRLMLSVEMYSLYLNGVYLKGV